MRWSGYRGRRPRADSHLSAQRIALVSRAQITAAEVSAARTKSFERTSHSLAPPPPLCVTLFVARVSGFFFFFSSAKVRTVRK